ncbi:PEP-CTERM sorting domain-containing protein [Tundrisphaera sp. TA3]|uniref:PEP-CTERM sorting domain-containing protein n=1 Tax=Tundrisphaera sp. TA3 TaxID=3435775 RepID=UPI003EB91430
MWRTTTRLATSTLIATLALLATSEARAAAVKSYSYTTIGSVGAPASTSDYAGSVGPIGFDGVVSGTMTTPGYFNLGAFTVAALPPSATLTYENTGFTIFLTGFGTGYTYRIDGVLNGTLDGSGASDMIASVTSVTGWGAQGPESVAPIALTDLRIIAPQAILAPANYQGSRTGFYGQVGPGAGLPVPAPEPASIAIVAVGLAAWGLKRRLRPAA